MNKEIEELDLGRFSDRINKSFLIPNEDGTFDYDGNLYFSDMGLKSLKEIPIQFKKIDGSFYCYENYLVSLEGCPLEVVGNFYCYKNNLLSLQYAPQEISKDLCCFYNNLLSKAHLSKIGGEIDFQPNPFSIKEKTINAIKRMTEEQRVAELKFFKENDSNAYEMMLKILKDYNLKAEEFKPCYTIK